MSKLVELLTHPDDDKRLGALCVLGALESFWNADDDAAQGVLFDSYSFALLNGATRCLLQSSEPAATVRCQRVLQSIVRRIEQRSAAFRIESSCRHKPKGWSDATLSTAVRELVALWGTSHRACRQFVIDASMKFAAASYSDAVHCFSSLADSLGIDWFVQHFEQLLSSADYTGFATQVVI